ncbi:AAA family ATPase [Mycobacteroides abscessus]|uniref:AAA family ATPase n=1 Tax=Mycobacteroides abscessus TaxID=36809 RepID=UPI001F1B7EA4|nr:AAA family ATPase [Mycobacteroides abscessus]
MSDDNNDDETISESRESDTTPEPPPEDDGGNVVSFKERMRGFRGYDPDRKSSHPPRTPMPPIEFIGDDRYGRAAMADELEILAATPEGARNQQLNTSAFSLAGLVRAGRIDEQTAINNLVATARTIGLQEGEIMPTIRSAFRGSDAKVGARQVPERDEIPAAFTIDPNDSTAADDDENAGDEPDAEMSDAEAEKMLAHRRRVQQSAYELRVSDEGRALYAAQQAHELGQTAPDPVSLTDFLSIPDEDAVYRIGALLPIGGRALLAAQYKAGKTTMMANLLRSLADGVSFLGKFPTTQVQRVTVIDTELDERMFRRWLRAQGIQNTERVQVLPMKGHLATFNILDPTTRASWAAKLHGSDFIVLDCLRPCLDALGLSEDKDAGKYLVAWDAFVAETAASESIVVHHMGHSAERSRGDSRLLDWPDVLWKIVREQAEEGEDPAADGGKRFFSAHGRDVAVAEGLLEYLPETGGLLLHEGGRAATKARDGLPAVIQILSDPEFIGGLGVRALTAKLAENGMGFHAARKVIKTAIEESVILVGEGARNAKIMTLNPSARLS